MQLWVGLGNPGAKYASNRHNIGFMALDRIAQAHGATPWRSKFQGQTADLVLAGEKILLLKPETFMNRSGQAVGEAMRYFKLAIEDVTVFHDELDLGPGKVRVKLGGGHAGHNGLRSLHGHIGEGYRRIRLGIGHPGQKERVAGYVLSDFSKADHNWLDPLLDGINKGASDLARGDPGRFMNAVALNTAPSRNAKDGGKAHVRSGPERLGSKGGTPPASTSDTIAAGKGSEAQEQTPSRAKDDDRSPLQKLMDRFR